MINSAEMASNYPGCHVLYLRSGAESENIVRMIYHGISEIPGLGLCYLRVINFQTIEAMLFSEVAMSLHTSCDYSPVNVVTLRRDVYNHPHIKAGTWTNVCYPTGVEDPIFIPPFSKELVYINWLVDIVCGNGSKR